jgi:hypothetical protein
MIRKLKSDLLLCILALILSGCGSYGKAVGSSDPEPFSEGYPIASEESQASLSEDNLGQIDKHTETAFEAYQYAQEEAIRWDKEAILYQIPPTRLMESNFGLAGGGPAGWFFMFKAADSPVELYIEIVNGTLYGKTEAQPIMIGEPKYILKSIDPDEISLDSDEALQIYLEDGGDKYFTEHPNIDLDFRLIHLEGIEHPVWSIFDSTDFANPLYNVDAINGEKTQDPFRQLKSSN